MGYGEVKHRSRQVAKMAQRHAMNSWRVGGRKVNVVVVINQASATSRRGVFEARACIARSGKSWGWSKHRRNVTRCGGLGRGTSPTKALKSALRELTREPL